MKFCFPCLTQNRRASHGLGQPCLYNNFGLLWNILHIPLARRGFDEGGSDESHYSSRLELNRQGKYQQLTVTQTGAAVMRRPPHLSLFHNDRAMVASTRFRFLEERFDLLLPFVIL